MRENKNLTYLVHGAVIAAIYVVLTLNFLPISYGPIQFRDFRSPVHSAVFTPAAVPGLFAGCLLSNLMGGLPVMDVVCGSLATLIGALGSRHLRQHKWCVCIPPILSNAIIVPWVLRFAYGSQDLIPLMMLTVGIGEIWPLESWEMPC